MDNSKLKKKYQIIYADPPWPINWKPSKKLGIKPLEYPTLPVTEVALLPVKEITSDICRLFLWTTNGFLPEALGVTRAWGFHFDKLWTWCKPTGAGGHPRMSTEHCIEATRGSLPKALTVHSSATNNWFLAPTGRHSKKPNNIRDFIELCYPSASKIELFARQETKGWDVWGNEVKSDIDLELKLI